MTAPPLRKMIDAHDVEANTGLSIKRQKKLRDEGNFCRWYRVGRSVMYVEAEFAEWLQAQAFKPYPGEANQQAETPADGQRRMTEQIDQRIAASHRRIAQKQDRDQQDEILVGGDDYDAT